MSFECMPLLNTSNKETGIPTPAELLEMILHAMINSVGSHITFEYPFVGPDFRDDHTRYGVDNYVFDCSGIPRRHKYLSTKDSN